MGIPGKDSPLATDYAQLTKLLRFYDFTNKVVLFSRGRREATARPLRRNEEADRH